MWHNKRELFQAKARPSSIQNICILNIGWDKKTNLLKTLTKHYVHSQKQIKIPLQENGIAAISKMTDIAKIEYKKVHGLS